MQVAIYALGNTAYFLTFFIAQFSSCLWSLNLSFESHK